MSTVFLEHVATLCLLTLIPVDIFITVRFARASTSLIGPEVERGDVHTRAVRRRQQCIDCGLWRIRTQRRHV
jgi:hypothetical protein